MLGHKEVTKYLQLHKVSCWGVLRDSLKKNLCTTVEFLIVECVKKAECRLLWKEISLLGQEIKK